MREYLYKHIQNTLYIFVVTFLVIFVEFWEIIASTERLAM